MKSLRIARGWPQQELATRMSDEGFSWRQTTVAKTEAADRPIRVNEAAALAGIFGITLNDLLTIPIDDVHMAQLTVEMGELRSLYKAASQRVNECERTKERAEAELSEARADLQSIAGKISVLEEQERAMLRAREEAEPADG